MKDFFESAVGIVVGIMLVLALIFVIDYLFLDWFKFIEPKKEDARREVFLNTRSFNEGKIQELVRYRLEYIQADDTDKLAIKSTIQHLFAEYNENRLAPELKSFLKQIKYGEQLK